ncbi:hypothetical protein I4U23_018587 [Adineta vaga]|nr:hypothetical protein I4U23_018587 [Adineta vaga]
MSDETNSTMVTVDNEKVDLNIEDNHQPTVTSVTNDLNHSNGIHQSEQLQQHIRSLENSSDNSEQPTDCKKELEPDFLRKIFIGGLSYKASEETCKAYFSQYGDVLDLVIMRDRDGRPRGFGFVTYKSSSMVDRFMAARPHVIDSREIEPKRAVPKANHDKVESSLNSKKLFVGGIRNETISEHDLNEYFAKYGNIIDAVLMKTNEGRSRGFGFVEFDDYDPVDKIVLEKTHILKGNTLNVQKALPKAQTKRFGMSTTNKGDQNGRYSGNNHIQPSRTSREQGSMTGRYNFGGTSYRSDNGFNDNNGRKAYNNRSTPYSNNWNHGGGSGNSMTGFSNSAFMNRNEREYEINESSFSGFDNLFGAFAGPSHVDFGQNYGSTFGGGPLRREGRAYNPGGYYGRN